MIATVPVNGLELGVERFGHEADPLVLLVGGTTMLSWPDALCERLAKGGRRVLRYDLRDSGASTTVDPEAPTYSLRDLAADAAALVPALGAGSAHLAGIGVGGMVAQVAEQARTTAGRPWDRTPVDTAEAHRANQQGTLFAHLDCTPRWRERLTEITLPSLVVHGRQDPFFPDGNAVATSAEIAGARLLVVEDMGTALPDDAADQVATTMVAIEGDDA